MKKVIVLFFGEIGKEIRKLPKCCSWLVSYIFQNFTGLNRKKSYLSICLWKK